MRKTFFLFTAILALHLCVSGQDKPNGKFILEGKFKGTHTRFLVLAYPDNTGKEISDTCYLKNGKFEFAGKTVRPGMAVLKGAIQTTSSDDPNFVFIFLEPGKMSAELLENNFKEINVYGSKTQKDWELLNNSKKQNRQKEQELFLAKQEVDTEIKKQGTSGLLKRKMDSLWQASRYFELLDKRIDYIFINGHPGSCLSPYLMDYYFGSRKLLLDSAELYFRRFTTLVRQSFYGKSIHEQIINRKLSATGMSAPLFSRAGINDSTISLASFRGKSYVLLDFWASWCIPCRELTPRLKKIYEKYHSNGLEIISISWDSDKKAWRDAISKDSTEQWQHIFANVFLPNDNGMRNKYAIASIPTFILIDKNGKIAGRYRGDGEDGDETEMFQVIDKFFSTK